MPYAQTIQLLDTPLHRGLRKELVALLHSKGIEEERVLAAIGRVPRHLFLGNDSIFYPKAYEDIAFPIGEDQTISQPYTVALQTQLLELVPREKVLEIGTGSGYQAAVLAEMGVKVYSIERQRELYRRTNVLLDMLGYRTIKRFFGDGYEGLEAFAPFDKIIITAAAPYVPPRLLAQLVLGGQMVLPLHLDGGVKMVRITRHEDQEYAQEVFSEAAFVPMLTGKEYVAKLKRS